jgi:hypothetical protein
MFKLFFRPHSHARPAIAFFHHSKLFFRAFVLILLTSLCGCLTMRPLPKVDLSEPGWTVRQGQAVWKTGKKTPEIAGEILLATKTNGSAFVQFTKTPFPFAIAQTTSNRWQIEFPPQNKHYAAPGKPPARIVWFQLANAFTGKPLAKGWTWHNSGTDWQLKNSSGESLEGYFAQ